MINKLLTLAKENNIEMEIFTNNANEYNINVLNDTLVSLDVNKVSHYQVKAIYDGKMVTLEFENLNNPERIISLVKSTALLVDNTNKNRLCDNDYSFDYKGVNAPDLNSIKNELLKLNDYRNKYPFISNVESYFYFLDNRTSIDNVNHHMNDGYSYCYTYVSISGSKGNVTKSISFEIYGKEFDTNQINKDIEKYIKDLELSLDATSIKTGKYRVLLDNEVVCNLMTSFSGAYYEKQLDMNLSPLSGKLGKKVFSDKITLLEEPLNEKFTTNKHFDNEGVLTFNKTIIDKGVFITPLNTLEYAIKNNTKPTGNASGTTNLYIKEGNKSYEELVKLLDNGIIINELAGYHAGINYQTGEISLQATGFLVENGKIVKALDMIILQTTLFEILSNVIEVGNDLKEFGRSGSSVSLLLNDITISGNID